MACVQGNRHPSTTRKPIRDNRYEIRRFIRIAPFEVNLRVLTTDDKFVDKERKNALSIPQQSYQQITQNSSYF